MKSSLFQASDNSDLNSWKKSLIEGRDEKITSLFKASDDFDLNSWKMITGWR